MPNLTERRLDASTALAAEPAVRAAERAIVTGSPDILADTLAISSATEARRRLAHVLDLKERATRDPARRDAYHRAADDLRRWAAGVYLANLRVPRARSRAARPRDRANRTPPARHRNPYTEESISLRRLVPRAPFPGQPRRHPFFAGTRADTQDAELPTVGPEQEATDPQLALAKLQAPDDRRTRGLAVA